MQGVITLKPKKWKNIKNILNWRPISLLNVDYKILTKYLQLELREFFSQLFILIKKDLYLVGT